MLWRRWCRELLAGSAQPEQAARLVKGALSQPVCLSGFLLFTQCMHAWCLHQINVYLVASVRFGDGGQSGKVRNHPHAGRKMAKAKLQLDLVCFRNEAGWGCRGSCLKVVVSGDPGHISSSCPFHSFLTLARQKFLMRAFPYGHYVTLLSFFFLRKEQNLILRLQSKIVLIYTF